MQWDSSVFMKEEKKIKIIKIFTLVPVLAVYISIFRLSCFFHNSDSEDSDQTGRMPRLIWVFAGHTWPEQRCP